MARTAKKEKSKKSATKKSKKTTKKAPAKAKGTGVIATIIELLKGKAMTKAALLKKLVKKYPDRSEDGMKATINCQVPGRLSKEKGLKVKKDDKGRFSIK